MDQDRRSHRRVTYPLTGNWRGSSGGVRCRIADLSLGGCYIQCLSVPDHDERTEVSIWFSDLDVMTFAGRATTPLRGFGFGFAFDPLDEDTACRLATRLRELEQKRAALERAAREAAPDDLVRGPGSA